MPKSSVKPDIDALYGLPPEQFTAARDRLFKQLRDDGRSAEAQEVKSLRRPTVPAWAVNQVVREHRREVEELLAAGEDLRRAQQRALFGKGGADLREGSERRRNALRAVAQAAEAMLERAGRASAPHLDAIRTTFESASLDREAAAELLEGRLVKELDAPAGFGDVTGLTLVQGMEGTDAKAATRRADQEARRRAREKREAEAAKARIAELRREAQRAEREAAKAERDADRARAEAVRLRKVAEQARQKADRYSRA
ncbi:MAG TPA: hypothetical protein VHI54_11155 [Actinomycetota bacterium]|nr:hypothetical protein [Actinomycetota bacterium]